MGDVYFAVRPDPMVFHAVRDASAGKGVKRAAQRMADNITIKVRRSPPLDPRPVRFHPDSCGKGQKVVRRPHLDEMDR